MTDHEETRRLRFLERWFGARRPNPRITQSSLGQPTDAEVSLPTSALCFSSTNGSIAHEASARRRSFVMSKSPNPSDLSANSEIPDLHRKRGEALLERQAEKYLEFLWNDAVLFIFDHRLTFDEMRRRLPLLATVAKQSQLNARQSMISS